MPAIGMISWSVLASIGRVGPPGCHGRQWARRRTCASSGCFPRPGDSIEGASPTTRQARSEPRRSLARAPPVYSPTSEPAIPPVSQRPALGCLFEVVETLVLTILIFLGIQTFVAQPYKVQQQSMMVTLLPEQYVLVDKLSPRWAPYARGDIVVFEPPASWTPNGDFPFIKRVIGIAGDRVELRDGFVYVNGVKLDEPYLYKLDG